MPLVTPSTSPPPPYTTVEDLRGALAPAGTPDGSTAAALIDAQLLDVVTEVSLEIDASLRDRYQVPFTVGQVPPLVVKVTRDIAAFEATLIHRRGVSIGPDEPIRLRYKRAQDLLDKLQAGKVDLQTPAPPSGTGGDPGYANPYEGDLFGLADAGLGYGHVR